MLGLFVGICADAADPCDCRADDDGGTAYEEKRNANGKGKGKDKQNQNANQKNARKCTAKKSVFTVCACGKISAEKSGYEKRDQGENRNQTIGILHGKPGEAGDKEKGDADSKRNQRAEKDGNKKTFFMLWLCATFESFEF